jgi:NitT/TauT family transport system substrate-binding protein
MCPVWSGFAPLLVANDLGYYKDEGLDVDVRFEDDRSNVMAAMERGDIDVDLRTIGEYQARPRTPATDGIIVGTIDQSLGGDGVVADGSINTVADLKGKTVAELPTLPALLVLQLDLKNAGLSLRMLCSKSLRWRTPSRFSPTLRSLPLQVRSLSSHKLSSSCLSVART